MFDRFTDRARRVVVLAQEEARMRNHSFIGTEQWVHRVEPGCPAFVSIVRDRARLFLSEHHGDARLDTLVHLFVSDVDAVVAEVGLPDGEPPLLGSPTGRMS